MVRFASAGNPAAASISAESWERMGSPDDLWVSFKPDPDDGPRLHLYWVEFESAAADRATSDRWFHPFARLRLGAVALARLRGDGF